MSDSINDPPNPSIILAVLPSEFGSDDRVKLLETWHVHRVARMSPSERVNIELCQSPVATQKTLSQGALSGPNPTEENQLGTGKQRRDGMMICGLPLHAST